MRPLTHGWKSTVTVEPNHHLRHDSVALTGTSHSASRSHKQITDICLPGLAVRNNSRLATLDRTIPIDAATRATPGHLALI